MSRVHDMGGRFGDGPVVPEAEGVVFHDDWHPRALAIVLASGSLGKWNTSNQAASSISAGSGRISPPVQSQVKAIINELGKGQGWLAK